MMNCILWNCRGANKPNFRRSIRYILKKFKTDVLAVFETHASGERAGRICHGLGFDQTFRVDAVGQSGGLWLLWRSEVGEVEVVESSDQFIYARLSKDQEVLNLIVVYAAPSVTRRSGLWTRLGDLMSTVSGPLMIGGDFNTILRIDERSGGNGQLSPDSIAFGNWINENSLIDMGFRGSSYTWRRGREERWCVAKRLDRVLCCPHARLKWHEATVTHLPFLASDHAPLYIQLEPEVRGNPRRRPFRFEAAWLSHPGFKELLSSSWQREISTPEALKKLHQTLRRWNKEVFGDVQMRKEKLMGEIKAIQDLLDQRHDDALLKKEEELLKEFECVLEQEEMLWFQKSREKWIDLGDRNTKFFHTSTVVRRSRNRVDMLKNSEDVWVTNSVELEQLATTYYKRLYSLEDVDEFVDSLSPLGFPRIDETDARDLNKQFVAVEVVKAVQSMGKFKAPGPDGFQAVFYQDCWDIVGESVLKFVLSFFATGSLPRDTNNALIALIPKVAKPERITQFRPISLCNVLFKIITKAMVGRLKCVMDKLVGPAQASFIPGRLSMDNIVVIQEAVHSMRRKKGRSGWMLLKLDLEKAYDRIRWDFLEDTLKAAGLSEVWTRWIMNCVSGPSMNLLWNGERTGSFQPRRGLRQGDPLSPYLFVLCMERLCHMIDLSTASKKWKPISISRGGPKLSHICFADDLILFAEASVSQIRIIRGILETFCQASGQKISLEKSKIFFSKNVSRELGKLISNESGIQATQDLGKYLGMPVLHKKINKDTFGEVLAKMTSRLTGWKGRFLSLAGRVTLTKAVLTSIPVHAMSTICLPKSILDNLDRTVRFFLWGSTAESRKPHLIPWNRVAIPKSDGGLGIRQATNMNKALIAKLGWRLLHDDSSLWARVLRKKYKVGDVRDGAWLVSKSGWSPTWRSVIAGLRDVVIPGMSWVLGDGCKINFWRDRWFGNQLISEEGLDNLSAGADQALVCDLWRNGRGWDMEKIEPYVSVNTSLQLRSIVLDNVTGAQDCVAWGESVDGEFSVKTAAAFLGRDMAPRPNWTAFYDRVWKVVAPERVRLFLWLVGNQALMTNAERFRRHLSDSDVCQVCRGGRETTIHILRDCPAMTGIWDRIVPQRRRGTFFQQTLLEWVFGNLSDSGEVFGSVWSTVFAMAIWWSWKWRCDNVFGNNGRCRDRTRFIKDKSKEVTVAHLKRVERQPRVHRVERMVGWVFPRTGWLKLNTDGASRGNPGLATAGGVLRNADGDWCGGFVLNIGRCSAPLAELWGVYYGLYIAWERRITQLEVEVDSELVVGFLKTGVSERHPLSSLVRLCHGFLSKDWRVEVSHVYREANRLADGLANYAFSLPFGFQFLEVVPPEVDSLLSDDVIGSARPRQVRV